METPRHTVRTAEPALHSLAVHFRRRPVVPNARQEAITENRFWVRKKGMTTACCRYFGNAKCCGWRDCCPLCVYIRTTGSKGTGGTLFCNLCGVYVYAWVYFYIHVCVGVCVHACVCMCARVCLRIRTRVCACCIHTHSCLTGYWQCTIPRSIRRVFVCVCACTYMCVCVCVYVYIYVHTCVCVCTHIYVDKKRDR